MFGMQTSATPCGFPDSIMQRLREMGISEEAAYEAARTLIAQGEDLSVAEHEVVIPQVLEALNNPSPQNPQSASAGPLLSLLRMSSTPARPQRWPQPPQGLLQRSLSWGASQVPSLLHGNSRLWENSDAQDEIPRSLRECPICLMVLQDADVYSEGCDHEYHRECFAQHVRIKVREGITDNIRCPLCTRVVGAPELVRVVSDQTAAQFDRFQEARAVVRDQCRKFCPTPNCDGVLKRPFQERIVLAVGLLVALAVCAVVGALFGASVSKLFGCPMRPLVVMSTFSFLIALTAPARLRKRFGSSKMRRTWGWPVQCSSCRNRFCFACGERWHPGSPCISDALIDQWAETHDTAQCPSCHAMIERSEGCNHMTCKCGHEFCWLCGQVYTSDHFNDFGHPQYGGVQVKQGIERWSGVMDALLLLTLAIVATDINGVLALFSFATQLWASVSLMLGYVWFSQVLAYRPFAGHIMAWTMGLSCMTCWFIFRYKMQGFFGPTAGDVGAAALLVVVFEILVRYIYARWRLHWRPTLFCALGILVLSSSVTLLIDKFVFSWSPFLASLLACLAILLGIGAGGFAIFFDCFENDVEDEVTLCVVVIIIFVKMIIALAAIVMLPWTFSACSSASAWMLALCVSVLLVPLFGILVCGIWEAGWPLPLIPKPLYFFIIFWFVRIVKELVTSASGTFPFAYYAACISVGLFCGCVLGCIGGKKKKNPCTGRLFGMILGSSSGFVVGATFAVTLRGILAMTLRWHLFSSHLCASLLAGSTVCSAVTFDFGGRRHVRARAKNIGICAVCVAVGIAIHRLQGNSIVLTSPRIIALTCVLPLTAARILRKWLSLTAYNRYTDALIAS